MENVTQSSAPKILKKITMKELGATGEQIAIVTQSRKEVFLADVGGVAVDIKTGETQYGPWTALKGSFVATDAAGTHYQSSTLIMPDLANDLILNELRNADDATHGVQFAFRIVAEPDTINGELRGKGYKYGAIPLLQPKPDDATSRLFALIQGQKAAYANQAPEYPLGQGNGHALPSGSTETAADASETSPEASNAAPKGNGKGKAKRA